MTDITTIMFQVAQEQGLIGIACFFIGKKLDAIAKIVEKNTDRITKLEGS